MDMETVVPGHGNLGTPETLKHLVDEAIEVLLEERVPVFSAALGAPDVALARREVTSVNFDFRRAGTNCFCGFDNFVDEPMFGASFG
jgi:hypothetical protein